MKYVRRSEHDGSKERLYGVWSAMIQRCHNPGHSAYPTHGGRGIVVCDAWKEYKTFRAWAKRNGGNRDRTAIVRVDLNGPYSPENCRIVPESELAWIIRAFGEAKTPGEWANDRRCVVPSATTLRARVRRGWDHNDAVTTPVRGYSGGGPRPARNPSGGGTRPAGNPRGSRRLAVDVILRNPAPPTGREAARRLREAAERMRSEGANAHAPPEHVNCRSVSHPFTLPNGLEIISDFVNFSTERDNQGVPVGEQTWVRAVTFFVTERSRSVLSDNLALEPAVLNDERFMDTGRACRTITYRLTNEQAEAWRALRARHPDPSAFRREYEGTFEPTRDANRLVAVRDRSTGGAIELREGRNRVGWLYYDPVDGVFMVSGRDEIRRLTDRESETLTREQRMVDAMMDARSGVTAARDARNSRASDMNPERLRESIADVGRMIGQAAREVGANLNARIADAARRATEI